ncbi:MAG: hypothetical protein WBP26_00365 [Candidatus Saccharimonadales bacterium]
MAFNRLHTDILQASFCRYDGPLANGENANNKLDLERIKDIPDLRQRVSGLVAEKVKLHRPQLIVPVPNGANWLGSDVAGLLDIEWLVLQKDIETKEISYFAGGLAVVQSIERLVVVEDVFRKFTNTNKVLALEGIGERAVAAEAIYDRNPNRIEDIGLPHDALVKQYIPTQLPAESSFWQFAGHA